MTQREIAARIREALDEIGSGRIADGERRLSSLVGELEAGRPWDQ